MQGCDGHGNLNAHIIAGFSDIVTGFPARDAGGYHYGLGVCPFVKVGSSVIFDPEASPPELREPPVARVPRRRADQRQQLGLGPDGRVRRGRAALRRARSRRAAVRLDRSRRRAIRRWSSSSPPATTVRARRRRFARHGQERHHRRRVGKRALALDRQRRIGRGRGQRLSERR